MQTKVRVFFDNHQILGIVIPDDDSELDNNHQKLVDKEHTCVDLPRGDYYRYSLANGLPVPDQLFAYIKSLQ